MAKRRVRVEGVDENIGVQKDHGSRVSSRSFSHVIVGRRGALRMASIHALLAHLFGAFRLLQPNQQETPFRLLLDVEDIPWSAGRQD